MKNIVPIGLFFLVLFQFFQALLMKLQKTNQSFTYKKHICYEKSL